jgi:hypothetical protein
MPCRSASVRVLPADAGDKRADEVVEGGADEVDGVRGGAGVVVAELKLCSHMLELCSHMLEFEAVDSQSLRDSGMMCCCQSQCRREALLRL